jgi:hypothetical protein
VFKQYLHANGYQDNAAYNSHFALEELSYLVAETKTCEKQEKRNHTNYNHGSGYGDS